MKNEITSPRINRAYHLLTDKSFDIRGREDRALVIRLNKRLVYDIGKESLTTIRGDALFIPEGASYSTRAAGDGNEYLIVRFSSEEPGEWELMHVDDLGEAKAIHSELCRALVFDDKKSRLRALSLFYRLLSLLSEGRASEEYLPEVKENIIRPALDYVKENIYSPELRIGELHRLAGISDVYFRRLFTAYAGMTPQGYVMTKRLERARDLIRDGAISKVKDIAEAVGYTDALYFSRIYKKRFGHSPSEGIIEARHRPSEKQINN